MLIQKKAELTEKVIPSGWNTKDTIQPLPGAKSAQWSVCNILLSTRLPMDRIVGCGSCPRLSFWWSLDRLITSSRTLNVTCIMRNDAWFTNTGIRYFRKLLQWLTPPSHCCCRFKKRVQPEETGTWSEWLHYWTYALDLLSVIPWGLSQALRLKESYPDWSISGLYFSWSSLASYLSIAFTRSSSSVWWGIGKKKKEKSCGFWTATGTCGAT